MQIELPQLVSIYVPRMGLLEFLWGYLSFTSVGGVTCGAVAYVNWKTASLHQIGSTVHVLTDLAIDAALSLEPDEDLLVPFTASDADMEPLCVRKAIYLPAPFTGLFLEL